MVLSVIFFCASSYNSDINLRYIIRPSYGVLEVIVIGQGGLLKLSDKIMSRNALVTDGVQYAKRQEVERGQEVADLCFAFEAIGLGDYPCDLDDSTVAWETWMKQLCAIVMI